MSERIILFISPHPLVIHWLRMEREGHELPQTEILSNNIVMLTDDCGGGLTNVMHFNPEPAFKVDGQA